VQYDVFNGDADGIFALHQFRLKYPEISAKRITGVKRDIKLLEQVEDVSNSRISVFDISLDSNRLPLEKILDQENQVDYFDHHFAGAIPYSPDLTTRINPSADTCTSLIVNDFLQSSYPEWAICGAYGDNIHLLAEQLAKAENLSQDRGDQLKELGELFNYNGYGADIEDLHYHPKELYLAIQPFTNPFDFIAESIELPGLREGYAQDMQRAEGVTPLSNSGKNRIYFFPDAPWARRVSGVYSNLRAREKTEAAHAIITENADTSYRISVRAPLNDKRDADTLCKKFPSGGGRAAAAGINNLPKDRFNSFVDAFQSIYS
jgi:hypothetical protein